MCIYIYMYYIYTHTHIYIYICGGQNLQTHPKGLLIMLVCMGIQRAYLHRGKQMHFFCTCAKMCTLHFWGLFLGCKQQLPTFYVIGPRWSSLGSCAVGHFPRTSPASAIAVTSFYILDSVETKPGSRLNQSLSCPTKVAVQVALLRLGFLSQDRGDDRRMVPVASQNWTSWPSIDPKSI